MAPPRQRRKIKIPGGTAEPPETTVPETETTNDVGMEDEIGDNIVQKTQTKRERRKTKKPGSTVPKGRDRPGSDGPRRRRTRTNNVEEDEIGNIAQRNTMPVNVLSFADEIKADRGRPLERNDILRLMSLTDKFWNMHVKDEFKRYQLGRSIIAGYLRNMRTLHPAVKVHPMVKALLEHINQIQSLLVFNQPNYNEIPAIVGPKDRWGLPQQVFPYSSLNLNFAVNRAVVHQKFNQQIKTFYDKQYLERIKRGTTILFNNFQKMLTNKQQKLRATYENLKKERPTTYNMPMHAASFNAFTIPKLWFPSYVRYPEGIRIFSTTIYFIHRLNNSSDYFAIHEQHK